MEVYCADQKDVGRYSVFSRRLHPPPQMAADVASYDLSLQIIGGECRGKCLC